MPRRGNTHRDYIVNMYTTVGNAPQFAKYKDIHVAIDRAILEAPGHVLVTIVAFGELIRFQQGVLVVNNTNEITILG
jgi:hypothetical protein